MPVIDHIPVVSKISNEMFTRLQTLVSSSNGAYKFRDVLRPTKRNTYTPRHGLVVLTRGEHTRVPELDCPGNPPAVAWMQSFLVRIHVAPSELDDTPVEFYEDVIQAEVTKAMCNSDTWHTFDDNAINAQLEPVAIMTDEGGYAGIAVPVNVTYRVSEYDPYESRP